MIMGLKRPPPPPNLDPPMQANWRSGLGFENGAPLGFEYNLFNYTTYARCVLIVRIIILLYQPSHKLDDTDRDCRSQKY